ncbi:hypothetical protein NF673_09700 [Pseudomonas moraviensis]|uniref:AbiU2 domain-containing protein n=1 Tax=Pseudomonas moraviensis TaxID=321662 RepID=UPI0020939C2D|nr:hypothetical protein [Pseudomonas moraviensis]UST66003.1 hypothetical protein NF673_09700 [Pseudomonas moraviensis]
MLSHKEVRAQCLAAMGADLGSMYCDLNDHLLDILLLWKQYEALFGVDQDTVRVLNDAAPTFFSVVQAQLWDGVMLGISRLTDPPVSAGKKTLSIRAIPDLVTDQAVKAKVENAINLALSEAEFTRAHRNKRIAHNDLVRIQNQIANPLPPASRQKIKAGLNAISVVLEVLNGHYRESTMLYDDLIFDGGAGSVVHLLRDALKHRHSELEL